MEHTKAFYKNELMRNCKMFTQTQNVNLKFSAVLKNIKGFSSALKAVNFDEDASFVISEDGLKIVVENSKNLQAAVYISKNYFVELNVPNDEILTFNINLNVITDILSLFSNTESFLVMLYKGYGFPLVLIFNNDDDIRTECLIKTKPYTEPIDYEIDDNLESFNNVILNGIELWNLFNEIDKSSDELELIISPKSPYFQIKTIDSMQTETIIEIPKTSDVIIKFSCKCTTSAKYKMSHMKSIIKPLSISTKVSIRTNSNGLLGIQFMVSSNNDDCQQNYDSSLAQNNIEFFIPPLVD